MKQDLENYQSNAEHKSYESPRMEVIEMEIEGPILQMSVQEADRQEW